MRRVSRSFFDDSEGILRWGQLIWSQDNWGVELYACTPENKFTTIDNGDKFTNVPEGPERIWEISWDLKTFTVKCNEVEVWKYQFSDHLPEFPLETCENVSSEEMYGPLKSFSFNAYIVGKTTVSALNIPIEYYSYYIDAPGFEQGKGIKEKMLKRRIRKVANGIKRTRACVRNQRKDGQRQGERRIKELEELKDERKTD